MNISVIGRHLNVREDTKALIEKKLAKFDKFFPSGADASVTCKSEGDEKRMEITISVGGPNLTMNPLLVEKHYMRKHGPNAYYGQKGQKH